MSAMESGWREKKGILIPLSVAVLGIWGYLAYQIMAGVSPGDEALDQAATTRIETGAVVDRDRLVPAGYQADFRDPFDPSGNLAETRLGTRQSTHRVTPRTAAAPPTITAPPPAVLPALQLVGIVGRTAMIRTPGGATAVVQVGQSVAGMQVDLVSRDSVVLSLLPPESPITTPAGGKRAKSNRPQTPRLTLRLSN